MSADYHELLTKIVANIAAAEDLTNGVRGQSPEAHAAARKKSDKLGRETFAIGVTVLASALNDLNRIANALEVIAKKGIQL